MSNTVRFQVLMVASMKMDRQGNDDGGSKHLRNIGKHLPDYVVQQPRRQPSSYEKQSEFSDILYLTWS
jgi:hypothetical protein